MEKVSIYKMVFSCLPLLFTMGMYSDLSMTEEVAPHQHVWELYSEISATCEEDGAKILFCACGEMEAVKIEKLGHQLGRIEGRPATCTQSGWAEYEGCIVCGAGEKVELPELAHELVQHDAQEPTCQSFGFTEYVTCTHCDYTTYQEIPMIGHNFTEEVMREPTCEEDGLILRICLDCSLTQSEMAKATGHVWDEGVQTSNAILYTCQKCFTVETEVGEHEHDYKIKQVVQNATCQTDGEMALFCACGDSITQVISAGHTYENGICARCGALEENQENPTTPPSNAGNNIGDNNTPEQGGDNTPEQGGIDGTENVLPQGIVLYELNDDETGYICIGTDDVYCSEIVIADTYKGLPVTEIAAKAFMNMYRLNRVTIGANIEKVGRFVFYDCPNIIEAYNRSNLSKSKIGDLSRCERVTVYTQEFESLLKINKGFVTYNNAEECCLVGYTGTAAQVTIPSGVTYICRRIFEGQALTKVTISASVKTIEYGAFQNLLLEEAVFENKNGWKCDDMTITAAALSDAQLAARLLTADYVNYLWKRS